MGTTSNGPIPAACKSEDLLQELDNQLTSSSTISTPMVRIKDTQLYDHLRNEELLAYHHFIRAMRSYKEINRVQSRLIEDAQDILVVAEPVVAQENDKVERDALIGLIREHEIALKRSLYEDPLPISESRRNVSGDESSIGSELPNNPSDQDTQQWRDYQLYLNLRREELLAYHHMVKAVFCHPNLSRLHSRLLEDLEYFFRIPPDRISLEKLMAESDPVILLIRAHKITKRRKMFDGRDLDNSYTLPSENRPDQATADNDHSPSMGNEAGEKPSSTLHHHEESIDRLYAQLTRKRNERAKNSISFAEWNTFLDTTLTSLSSMKADITRIRDESNTPNQ